MIYFFYGTDKDKARKKARELADVLLKKKPDASFFQMDDENFSLAKLEEFIGGQGLFENKYIVFLNSVLQNKEAREVVLEKLREAAESPNIFIFLEGKMDKATMSKIEKKVEKTQEFKAVEIESTVKEKFNIFSLADIFGRRDKKNLWVLYQQAIFQNAAPEEVSGILFWQLKSMIVASKSKSAKEAGLNPYVFQKSKSLAQNYSGEEMEKLSSALVSVYHDSRRGIHDFDIALERFILGI